MAYIQRRLQIFKKLKADFLNQNVNKVNVNGKLYDRPTTPQQVGITTMFANVKFAEGCCPHVIDVMRPLTRSCTVEPLEFDQDSYWHSSAHVLGSAIEKIYPESLLAHGPPTDQGFFYDFNAQEKVVTESDYGAIEATMMKICNKKVPFERIELTKDQAMDLFSYNKYKVELIESKIQVGEMTSVYALDDFIDLCTGPHFAHAGHIKAIQILKNSSSYWQGDSTKDSLQRIHAITFPEKAQLKEFNRIREEAQKRDHRVLGQNQHLFFWNNKYAPGSAFFLPHGTIIYNKLVNLMKHEYRKRGFKEVLTPNIFNVELWKVSGHYKNYKDDLFLLPSSDGTWQGLKPMNCPAHCLIYAQQVTSYKDLPLKLADFGVLHRNELTGALSGLTRVRRFQQDDAHIFCRPDQIQKQITECLEFLDSVYGLFGFKYEIKLATKPANSIGSSLLWEQAEYQLKQALTMTGREWGIKEGDGAFYGPKIDIQIKDALGRPQQCGTIQLDFQLPIRFNLQYNVGEVDQNQSEEDQQLQSEIFQQDEYSPTAFEWKEQKLKNGFARPVMIHRAILGSMERFTAILTEHLAAKWPLWLSPRQIMVIPINEKHIKYCQSVKDRLQAQGFEVEIDIDNSTINKKVRNAQLLQFNYIVCAGDEEISEQMVDIRSREGVRIGKKNLEDFTSMLMNEYPSQVPQPQLDNLKTIKNK